MSNPLSVVDALIDHMRVCEEQAHTYEEQRSGYVVATSLVAELLTYEEDFCYDAAGKFIQPSMQDIYRDVLQAYEGELWYTRLTEGKFFVKGEDGTTGVLYYNRGTGSWEADEL